MNGADVLILIEGEVVGSQRDVTFEHANEAIDFSSKDSRARRVDYGRYSSTVSLDALYVPTNAAYVLLAAACEAGTKVQVMRQEEGVITRSAMAVISSLSEAAPDQDAVTISISFEIDGEWTDGS